MHCGSGCAGETYNAPFLRDMITDRGEDEERFVEAIKRMKENKCVGELGTSRGWVLNVSVKKRGWSFPGAASEKLGEKRRTDPGDVVACDASLGDFEADIMCTRSLVSPQRTTI